MSTDHTCDPSMQGPKEEFLRVQGYNRLFSEFQARIGYRPRLYLQKAKSGIVVILSLERYRQEVEIHGQPNTHSKFQVSLGFIKQKRE